MISSTSVEWSHLHSQTVQSMDRPDPAYSPSHISSDAETPWSQGITPFISKRGKRGQYKKNILLCPLSFLRLGSKHRGNAGMFVFRRSLKRGFPPRIRMPRRPRMVLELLIAWIVRAVDLTGHEAPVSVDETLLSWNPLRCVRCYCLRPFQGKHQRCSRNAIFRVIQPLQSTSPETSNIISNAVVGYGSSKLISPWQPALLFTCCFQKQSTVHKRETQALLRKSKCNAMH